ncbi:hypothetical protein ABZX95_12545 [Streptomyces sp. NPDC004232]|uniref:hypothetical protein n=1 Tax=Streptomyces sp. NPDC004232 TaxID=3154454 RepID=UPI001DC4EF57|nr:hypothetical protein [Streptomyces sp. tea 10]
MKWKLGRRAVRAAMVGSMVAGSVVLANGSAQAAEGQWTLSTSYCSAVVKIELHSYPDGLHDAQAIDPTRIVYPGACHFSLIDNGRVIYDSDDQPNPAAQSPWEYDGPWHSMYGRVYDSITGEQPTSTPN